MKSEEEIKQQDLAPVNNLPDLPPIAIPLLISLPQLKQPLEPVAGNSWHCAVGFDYIISGIAFRTPCGIISQQESDDSELVSLKSELCAFELISSGDKYDRAR
ncbi:MAG: hypothetical protein ABID54_14965 [Pseudomonadota bacterium]